MELERFAGLANRKAASGGEAQLGEAMLLCDRVRFGCALAKNSDLKV